MPRPLREVMRFVGAHLRWRVVVVWEAESAVVVQMPGSESGEESAGDGEDEDDETTIVEVIGTAALFSIVMYCVGVDAVTVRVEASSWMVEVVTR
jgi:hypothetical protein